jgi:hypothetical protein
MPVVLLVKENAEILERVTVETLASLVPRARITTVAPRSTEQLTGGSEWTQAIAEALLVRGPDMSASC